MKLRKNVISEEQLRKLYLVDKKSTRTIGKMFNVSKKLIKNRLVLFNIPVRSQEDFLSQVGFSTTHRQNIAKSRKGILVGEKCGSWKGGLTVVYQLIRGMPEYIQWRTSIFQRDKHLCVICNEKNKRLNADHIIPLWLIIREEKIKGTLDARNCGRLWDLNNGRSLCVECHKKTDTYGRKALKAAREWDSNKKL